MGSAYCALQQFSIGLAISSTMMKMSKRFPFLLMESIDFCCIIASVLKQNSAIFLPPCPFPLFLGFSCRPAPIVFMLNKRIPNHAPHRARYARKSIKIFFLFGIYFPFIALQLLCLCRFMHINYIVVAIYSCPSSSFSFSHSFFIFIAARDRDR